MNKNEKRDSFVFYRSFYEAINELASEEQLSLYRSIADYSLNGLPHHPRTVSYTKYSLA